VEDALWNEWLAHRKRLKCPVTDTVLRVMRREADTAGITLAEAMETTISQGWKGFRADYVAKRGGNRTNGHSGTNGWGPRIIPPGYYGGVSGPVDL
jgi:hypothetical protein